MFIRKTPSGSGVGVVRNIAILASGVAGAQGISLLLTPVITRLYNPDAFGVFGAFAAVLALMSPVAALGYPIAIVLPRSDQTAIHLIKISLYISTLVAMAVLVVVTLIETLSYSSSIGISMGQAIFWLPIALLFAATTQVTRQWLIRKRAFGVVSRSAVIYSMSINSSKILLGLALPVGSTLIMINALGNALYTGVLLMGVRKVNKRSGPSTLQESKVSLCEIACRYKDFPLYRAPQDLINSASQSIPVLFLAISFGAQFAGYYALAKTVVGMPTALLGKSVSDVIYPKLSEDRNHGLKLSPALLKATATLFTIGMLPFGLLFAYGPTLFGVVFGEAWVNSGEYARWLAPLFLLNFANRPCVAAAPVLGLQRGLLVYEVLATTARIAALVGGFWLSETGIYAVAAFSLTGVVAYSIMITWIILESMRDQGQ